MENFPSPRSPAKPTSPLEALRNAVKAPEGLRELGARARSAALILALWAMQAVPAHSQTIMDQDALPDETVAGLMDEIGFARQFMLGESAREFLRNRGWSEEAIEEEIRERTRKLDQSIVQALDEYVYADAVLEEIATRKQAGLETPEVELTRDQIAHYTSGLAFGEEGDQPGIMYTNLYLYNPNDLNMLGVGSHELGHLAANLEDLEDWFRSFLKRKFQANDNPNTYSEYLAQPGELWGHGMALSRKLYGQDIPPDTVTAEDLKGLQKICSKDPLLEEAKTIFQDGFEGLARMIREMNGSSK